MSMVFIFRLWSYASFRCGALPQTTHYECQVWLSKRISLQHLLVVYVQCKYGSCVWFVKWKNSWSWSFHFTRD